MAAKGRRVKRRQIGFLPPGRKPEITEFIQDATPEYEGSVSGNMLGFEAPIISDSDTHRHKERA